MEYRIALAIPVIAIVTAGCSGSSPAASSRTTTVTVTASSTPQINAAFFTELERLNDKFIATVTGIPDIRAEIMDRRDVGTAEMAQLAQDLCMTMLSRPVEGGPDSVLLAAGTYLELSMYIPDEPMSHFTKTTFARIAAETFCPDNVAGLR